MIQQMLVATEAGSDTPGGVISTSYTVTDIVISAPYPDTTRIVEPNVRVTGTAVVFCHGLGQSYATFDPSTNRYSQNALSSGYMLLSGDYGGQYWSAQPAQDRIVGAVAYLVSHYAVTDIVLWSESAGGTLGLMMATTGFSGVSVRGWFGIYPCVDLNTARSVPSLTTPINDAFPAYPADAVGRDPILIPAASYNGLRLRCCQSPADTILPKPAHGDALVTLTTGHATEVACIATTGDHGDASNFTQARADDFLDFLNRCF
jgi:pimeloyl-ACP methyl ester carboxylesterase